MATGATSGRPRVCTEWLPDMVHLSELGNVHTEVDYNPKTDY